jgi:hypothetical protein
MPLIDTIIAAFPDQAPVARATPKQLARKLTEPKRLARQRRQPHSTPQMPRQAPTQLGHFSESEIDHFVMAITSAEAMVRHTTLIGRLK